MPDVYIAEGHGRRPDGTFDPGAASGVHNEQRDSKPVAEACTRVLRDAGLEVLSESDMADDPNFYGTTARANQAGVKCVVSFHYDWVGAPPGAFAIATTNDGRDLGWAIEERVADAGFDIRDYPDDRDGLYLLDNSHAPAVIFECGRIGHHAIDESDEQSAMGEAAALGVLDWLGVDTMPKIPKPPWLPWKTIDRLIDRKYLDSRPSRETEDMWRTLTFLERADRSIVSRLKGWARDHVGTAIAAAVAAGHGNAQVDYGELVRRIGEILAGS